LFIEFFNKRNNSVLQVKRKINSLQEKFQKMKEKRKMQENFLFLRWDACRCGGYGEG